MKHNKVPLITGIAGNEAGKGKILKAKGLDIYNPLEGSS